MPASPPGDAAPFPAPAGAPLLQLRRLGGDDAPACVALTHPDWQNEVSRWQMMLTAGDAFGAGLEDGALAGTVIVNRFGPLATIAMMFVGKNRRRLGVGRALMARALEQAGDATVYLYASEMGRPLYEGFGFVAMTTSTRLEGRASPTHARAHGALRAMTADDLTAVVALDEEAQGGPRWNVLEGMYAVSDRRLVALQDGAITGFGLSSVHLGTRLLGPIVAHADADACALAEQLAAGSPEPVRIDLQPGERALASWAQAAGLTVAGTTPLMTLQGAPLPGQRALVRALASRAFG